MWMILHWYDWERTSIFYMRKSRSTVHETKASPRMLLEHQYFKCIFLYCVVICLVNSHFCRSLRNRNRALR